MLLPCQPNSKSGETNKAALPKWLLSRDQFPPYWLLSDDLPPWFLAEGPPKWLFEKGFNPPAWLRQDEIPRIITASYGSEGPPLWLLNMDRFNRSIYTYLYTLYTRSTYTHTHTSVIM
jgi:hypothetical protein